MTADAQLIREASALKAATNITNETNRLIAVAVDDADNADAFTPPSVGQGVICAQCGAGPSTEPRGDAPTIKVMNGGTAAWVHADCRRFWIEDHPQ